MEELNKPDFKPKFQSEYSMGEYDFKRFDTWLGKAEFSSAVINSCEVPSLEQVQGYFAELNVLYKMWRNLISNPKTKNDLDEAIKTCKISKRLWESSRFTGIEQNKNNIFSLIDKLDEIHTKLLEVKQIIGLGIVIKKVISTKDKIKLGVHGHRDLTYLPEA